MSNVQLQDLLNAPIDVPGLPNENPYFIRLHPEPTALQPASIDIHLGDHLIVYKSGEGWNSWNSHTNPVVLKNDEPFLLYPRKHFVLASTFEILTLGNGIAAQLIGNSSSARRGLVVHQEAGWIDPGWEGQITLELTNSHAYEPYPLRAGMRIGQFIFHKLEVPANPPYRGRYRGQVGPTEARPEQ